MVPGISRVARIKRTNRVLFMLALHMYTGDKCLLALLGERSVLQKEQTNAVKEIQLLS